MTPHQPNLKNKKTKNDHMKKFILTIGLLIVYSTLLLCQVDKEITSSIKSITLYTQGAQIKNEATVSLQQGQMVLKFTKLSPYIKKESIRIEGDGSFTIQNVQHQNDYVNELEKNKETAAIRTKIEEFQDKIEYELRWSNCSGQLLFKYRCIL